MIYLLMAFGIVLVGLAVAIIIKLANLAKKEDGESLRLLNDTFNARMRDITEQFNIQTTHLNSRLQENSGVLQESNKSMNERLDNAARFLSSVSEQFGKMNEATKHIADLGKDIAGLHDILRAPKLRGTLGEFFLNDILGQYFPKDKFAMPFTFRSGEKVDAALYLADGKLVPIDSKFPLENFRKMIQVPDIAEAKKMRKLFMNDVKKRIDEIARYILPDEGTMDFALLYIPAENVYYEVIIKDEEDDSIASYAFKKRVIPVSPNNFFVYLQTILIGLRGLQIEKNAYEIQGSLIRLKGDFNRFGDSFDIIGSHLTNANNKFEEAKRRFDKLTTKLESIELSQETAPQLEV